MDQATKCTCGNDVTGACRSCGQFCCDQHRGLCPKCQKSIRETVLLSLASVVLALAIYAAYHYFF
jgi:hypothetical protein